MAASTLAPVRTLGHVRRWCSTTEWGAAGWQQCLAAVIVAVLFRSQSPGDAAVGLDPSWQAGLALARVQHLAWGPEIVFTYGPLGFLQTTAYYSFGQSVLATIYQVIVVAALFLGIAAALRQRHAPMTSLIGAFIATGVATIVYNGIPQEFGISLPMMYPDLAVLATFVWAAVPLLQDNPKRSTVLTTCLVVGAVAGFQLLVKLNSGIGIVAIALAASVLLGWKAVARHCATVATFAASMLASWVLAGQRPGNLPAWLRYSAAVTSGYSEGRSTLLDFYVESGEHQITFTRSAIVLVAAWVGALCVMFVRGGSEIPRRFVVLVGLATLISARAAFGHFEAPHFSILVGLIVVAVAITPLSWARLAPKRRRTYVVAVVVIVIAQTCLIPLGFLHGVEALKAPGEMVDRLVTLTLPGRFGQRVERVKADQRALYRVPDRFIKTIGTSTVHVDPFETSAVWAYDLAWRPAPVFQTYQAYNPTLDGLNTEPLDRGWTQFVLSRLSSAASPATGIDGHLGVQESPRYSRALLCNYTISGVENRWVLLTHTGPHCGQLTALSQVPVGENEMITVPTASGPNMAVLVGIDLQPTIIDQLFQGTVAPLTIPTVVLDGVAYRLMPENAAEPFLVSTPSSVDGTNLEIHAHTIGVGRAPSLGQGDVTARLRFYEMRVEP
jgi:hypothetical protein